jgi:ATP-dependent Zn protease
VRGREAILKVHARNIKMDPAAELSVIARGTPGFSGAELANLLNEAALLAARQNKKAVGMTELNEARDKVRWGRERRSLAMTDEEKQHTAWHEAGHALVNVLLQHTHPLHKVTIIPRGRALGLTMMLPEKDVFSQRRKHLMDDLAVAMAGRIAGRRLLKGLVLTRTRYPAKPLSRWRRRLGLLPARSGPYSDESVRPDEGSCPGLPVRGAADPLTRRSGRQTLR